MTLALALLAGCAGSKSTKATDTAGSRPPPPPAVPGPATPIQAMVASMHESIVIAGDPGQSLISLHELSNHSHATSAEFDQMRARLADALGRASAEQRLPMRFVADAQGPGDFQLSGTVYLVTSSGFDQWEMYLDLRSAGGASTIWRPEGAWRMLREPRPGQPDMQFIPTPAKQ